MPHLHVTFWQLFAVMSATVWGLTRLVILEKIIDGTRDKVMVWLDRRSDKLWAEKLSVLLGCAFCVSWWVSIIVVVGADDPMGWFSWNYSIPAPFLMIWAVRTAALAISKVIDD